MGSISDVMAGAAPAYEAAKSETAKESEAYRTITEELQNIEQRWNDKEGSIS